MANALAWYGLAGLESPMSLNPVMLAVRFVLELTAVVSFAVFGWRAFDFPWRYVTVIALPLIAAALWGTFAVDGDASRSGQTAINTAGLVRLALELIILLGAPVVLWPAELRLAAVVLAVVTLTYFVLAFDRIGWLLRH